jgi:predicted phosphoadenosine phosphosulfate sulfurtransferase
MRQRIAEYITTWETRGYPEGIPDEADFVLEALNKVPSFRAICRAIMKNDVGLLSLGYARETCETYMMLKRIELVERGVLHRSALAVQLRLPLRYGGR